MQTYTPGEIRTVLRAADKDRNGHLWYLALSGLRRGEIAGLKWSDVNLGDGTIAVARSRVELGGGPTTVPENEPKPRRRGAPYPWMRGCSPCCAAPRHATHKKNSRSPQPTPTAATSHAPTPANRTRRAR
jgi:hypothetical protein